MARKSFKATGRKWTLAKATKLTPAQVATMKEGEKAELAAFYYRQYNLRVNSYLRAKDLEIPFAFQKLLRDFEELSTNPIMRGRAMSLEYSPATIRKGKVTLSRMFDNNPFSSQSLSVYINTMRGFFTSKSSTVSGWKEIALQQDIRLFGADIVQRRRKVNGKWQLVDVEIPKRRLTDDERRKFWAIYHEAMKAGWDNVYGYDSTQQQRALASLWVSGNFEAVDIDTAYKAVTAIIESKTRNRVYPEYAPGDSSNPTRLTGDNLGGDIFSGS